ncbi:ubiquitin protein ligase [Aureococcus anophagefferens]|nr:ubiquitin protein ligase [Aureococcus anophagefferens]
MVQIQRPYGVAAGTAVEVDIEGRQYYVTIPEGVPEGGTFNAQRRRPTYESPLPPGWEEKFTPEGKPYYVDHNTKSTHWERPAPAPPSYGAPPAY